ncbi:hypothetical protein [Streptomyces ochraceiscleroticus]|uniref:Uncharacterized protein n=1 Tax=Streptomyces ochraceiscleroticus TaxID=47761 RepID=A0ABW1MQU0_9ACTN|nr:hypothetical protein [Streptomyces ochraceiscleroticus]
MGRTPQRARIMVTVKTYPELSKKYRETSCVAGVRLDDGAPRHVRLFPVPFRLLAQEAQFTKYSIIEVDVERHRHDQRPESLRPRLESLKVLDQLSPADGWSRRWEYLRPLVSPSLCAIRREQARHGSSLGLFRLPSTPTLKLADAEPWPASKAALADQLDLLEQDLKPLEWVPVQLRYRFTCSDRYCPGHAMHLKDWEAGESYRKYLHRYGQGLVREKLYERWLTRMFRPDRAVHAFVGNIKAHPHTFMLLGLAYPLRTVAEYAQGDLFAM